MTSTTIAARITPEQLADAEARSIGYDHYAATIPGNGPALRENYEAVAFTPDERAAIDAISGNFRLLAIVEEWCPDVIANLPVFARIAEANAAIVLHILYRPDHRALADAYPGPADRSHIPTYILFDADGTELDVLVERPPEVSERVLPYSRRVQAEIAERFPGFDRKDYPADFVSRVTAEALALRKELRDVERAGVIDWLRRAMDRARR